jgi:hypothetical protein
VSFFSLLIRKMEPVTNIVIQRALKLLESQRRASKKYYVNNKDAIKAKSVAYWETHREAINEKRRIRYQAKVQEVKEKVPELK